jgi:hypothetical protein
VKNTFEPITRCSVTVAFSVGFYGAAVALSTGAMAAPLPTSGPACIEQTAADGVIDPAAAAVLTAGAPAGCVIAPLAGTAAPVAAGLPVVPGAPVPGLPILPGLPPVPPVVPAAGLPILPGAPVPVAGPPIVPGLAVASAGGPVAACVDLAAGVAGDGGIPCGK